MKILTLIITVIAVALVIFNFTKVNFDAPFEGESTIALITILAALCAVLIMVILYMSKQIEQKVKQGK